MTTLHTCFGGEKGDNVGEILRKSCHVGNTDLKDVKWEGK